MIDEHGKVATVVAMVAMAVATQAVQAAPGRAQAQPPSSAPKVDARHQALITRHVERGASPPERLVRRVRTMRRSPHAPTWVTVAAGVLLALSIGIWPFFQNGFSGNGATAPQIAKSNMPDAQARLPLATSRPAVASERYAGPKPTAPPISIATPSAAERELVRAA